MNSSHLCRKIQTVGKWYFTFFLEEILNRYNVLQDEWIKQEFIKLVCISAEGGEITYASARTKVDAMLAIIRENAVCDALKIIITETNPAKVPPGTIEHAVSSLQKIESGRLRLPERE